jgi:hypothetical protein
MMTLMMTVTVMAGWSSGWSGCNNGKVKPDSWVIQPVAQSLRQPNEMIMMSMMVVIIHNDN